MASAYDPKNIEKKWQETWEKEGVYKTSDSSDREKFYVLDMFPYPSGAGLHVGHPRGYIGSDVLARMRRMQGYNVLHPMGFDAFGLPAEQYAIQTGEHPSIVTEKAIATYKKQLEIIGFSFDWSREVRTIDPAYYRWTQWIFLQLFDSYYDAGAGKAKPIVELVQKFEKEDATWKNKSEKEQQDVLMQHRLAFEGYSEVNWCPELGTVLANDEVEDGPNGTLVSERGGFPVEKKNMRQWFLRITSYAERLLSGLDTLDWPEHIKEIQRNWIGKSEGAEIEFKISARNFLAEEKIPVMVDSKNPPVEGKKDVKRRTIHGIVYSPERDAYLTLVWKNYDWKTIIVGGVDDGENLVDAARREIKEETGYTDLQFEGILGGPVESHYFAAHKDENRTAITSAVYFTLRSEEKLEVAKEEVEHHEMVWTPAAEFVEEKMTNIEIPLWLERITELKKAETIKVFTTRPDTLFGVAYLAVAGTENKFTGKYAINPANGEEVPVWEADYVMEGYGTGAVMGVPAHDERDFEFAKKNNLPFKQVVAVDFKGIGKYAIRDGVETKERRTITVALENKKGEILIINEPDTITLIGGGIESGETAEEAAMREIKEETGYTNVKLSPVILPNYFAHSFRHVKQTNVKTNDYIFHAILEDETKIESEADKGRHVLKWVPRDEVVKTIPDFHHHNHIWRLINHPVFTDQGRIVNSGEFNGLSSQEAKQKITEFVDGKMVTKYRMRDAIFARQRYWGEPIPFRHKDGIISPLSEKELPLELPNVDSYKPTGTGESPLAGVPEWVSAGYETNTMPGWAGSSWYFLRYMDPHNDTELASKKAIDYWQNVDVYVGGSEHSTGHLIYARFWHKFLHDIGAVATEEPFKVLRNQGFIIASDGRKMSKRWGNVINPDEMVERFGADAFRLYEMFIGPFSEYTIWNTDGVVGTRRFLEKVWKLKEKIADVDTKPLVHKATKKVGEGIANFKFNTCVSDLMILVNALEKENSISKSDFNKLLQILAPFAPHMTEELWREMGETGSIHLSKWPKYDESKIKDEKIKIAVQINSKVRDEIEIDPEMSEEDVRSHVLVREKIVEKLAGAEPKNIIYVKGRLINIVV